MLDLCGYHRPAPNLDWQQLAGDYAQVISQTCGMLDVASLAGAIDLKWNGRYTKRAADAVWDSDTQHGHIRLAKKLWRLLITDEQQEVLVHATCLLIHAARPDLAKAPDRGEYYVGAEGPLLAPMRLSPHPWTKWPTGHRLSANASTPALPDLTDWNGQA